MIDKLLNIGYNTIMNQKARPFATLHYITLH